MILVDENDTPCGRMEKLEAHEKGLLHRAFSIFIINSKGQVLLQKRALSKYHSPGLWTNTCCSHPRPGESLMDAAKRRLYEEMGFSCPLVKQFSFTYRTEFENNLIENEYDHVLFGRYDNNPIPNPDEVDSWKWVNPESITNEIRKDKKAFTSWFKIIWDRVAKELKSFSI